MKYWHGRILLNLLAIISGVFLLSACGSESSGPEAPYSPPFVSVGSDRIEQEQSKILLTGTYDGASSKVSSVQWRQTKGKVADIANIKSHSTEVTLPIAKVRSVLTFEFSVTDSTGNIVSDSVDVTILPMNTAPAVTTGADFSAPEQSLVEISAIATDEDGSIEKYEWQQVSGPPVLLKDHNSTSASFSTPAIIKETELEFSLTVTDDETSTASDHIKISIFPIPEVVVTFPGNGRFSGDSIDIAGRIDAYDGRYSQIKVTASTIHTTYETFVDNQGRWRITDFSLGDEAEKQVITVSASDHSGFSNQKHIELEVGPDFTIETDVVELIEPLGYIDDIAFDDVTEKVYTISTISWSIGSKITAIDPVSGKHTISIIESPGKFLVDSDSQKLIITTSVGDYSLDEYSINNGQTRTLLAPVRESVGNTHRTNCLFKRSRKFFTAHNREIIQVDLTSNEKTIILNETTGSGDLLTRIQSITCDEENNTIVALDVENRNGGFNSLYDINVETGARTLRATFYHSIPLINPDAIAFDSSNNTIIMTAQGNSRTIQRFDSSTNTMTAISDSSRGQGSKIDYSPRFALDVKNQRVFLEGKPNRLLMADIVSGDRVIINW